MSSAYSCSFMLVSSSTSFWTSLALRPLVPRLYDADTTAGAQAETGSRHVRVCSRNELKMILCG